MIPSRILFSRRHYLFLADAIRHSSIRREPYGAKHLQAFVAELAQALRQDNPSFIQDKFIDAAGFGTTVDVRDKQWALFADRPANRLQHIFKDE